jgi:hypothetical protein
MERQFASLAAKLDEWQRELQDDQEASKTMDFKAKPEEMESKLEHWEVPKEDAIGKPVKGQKRQHRGQKQAAGQCGEPKELTRGDCGSGRRLAATCWRVSCCAAVAWCKRNVFRKI